MNPARPAGEREMTPMNPGIDKDRVEALYQTRFLKFYDLQYAPGKHYYQVSRRESPDLVVRLEDEAFRQMLPDAVTIAVVLHLPEREPLLLMSYEYRYPIGQFLLSPVAGLLDPADRQQPDPLRSAAVREIHEETGLTVRESDPVYLLNPCVFSSPGMTDECNAFLCAEITLDSTDSLSQDGAEGTELFDGFELLDRARAKQIFDTGRDEHGNFYSLSTWAVLAAFLGRF